MQGTDLVQCFGRDCDRDRILVPCGFGLVREALAAGAAYVVDTAEVSEPGACKVESWASAAGNHDFLAATSPACVVNIFRPVEQSTQFSRARADEEWATAAAPKIKTNLVPTAIGSWGFAISNNTMQPMARGSTGACPTMFGR
ncbi:MAG TPA: hypothetical protein VFL53_11755 [Pseudolabrys sp.]|nr:hypothetical protein [Pseudolabrys sp.]